MKHKIGELMNIYWDDDDHPEYVRGHVSMQEAKEAIKNFYGEVLGEFTLKHKYARWVFSSSQDYDHELKVYDEPQRGAFAVTEIT